MSDYSNLSDIIKKARYFAHDMDMSFWVLGNHRDEFLLCFDEDELRNGTYDHWDWIFILPYDDIEDEIREYFLDT